MPKGTILVAEVILDFSTLRGTKPQILTPKRYDDHPHHFNMGGGGGEGEGYLPLVLTDLKGVIFNWNSNLIFL